MSGEKGHLIDSPVRYYSRSTHPSFGRLQYDPKLRGIIFDHDQRSSSKHCTVVLKYRSPIRRFSIKQTLNINGRPVDDES